MDLSKLKVDSAKIATGSWVGDIPSMGDLRLKVRGISAPAFVDAQRRLMRGVAKDERNRDGTLPSAVADRVTGTALHQAVLLDWDNLTTDGKTAPYDASLALQLLTDPDYAMFRDAVVWAAGIVSADEGEVADAILGNSAPPSNTTSNGGKSAQI
jgi:hypothetical protein